MAESVQEFFDGLATRADATKTAGMNNSYLFDIEGAGQWIVAVTDGVVSVTEGGGEADAHGGDRDPTAVEDLEELREPLAALAEEVALRNSAVGEGQLPRI